MFMFVFYICSSSLSLSLCVYVFVCCWLVTIHCRFDQLFCHIHLRFRYLLLLVLHSRSVFHPLRYMVTGSPNRRIFHFISICVVTLDAILKLSLTNSFAQTFTNLSYYYYYYYHFLVCYWRKKSIFTFFFE